jgi:hypothetical protein
MESSQIKDLHEIFGQHFGTSIFDSFLEILDSILSVNPREVILRTRNDEGQILSFGNVQYFSLVSPQKSKPVICAGATEPHIFKHPIPVIRFTNTNSYLKTSGIPQKHLFPYSKPDWTYVCLNGDTILSIKKLIEAQINIFYERPTDPTENTSLTHANVKSPVKPVSMAGPLIGTFGIILAIVGGLVVGAPLFFLGLVIFLIGVMLSPSSNSTLSMGASGSSQLICPHCQTKGSVTTRKVTKKAGISGAKATGAILTGGLSILATGLSRKEQLTESHCSHCNSTWRF